MGVEKIEETEKGKTIIACVGLICLTALQLFSWYTGHNGVVFATTSAIFGGIIGYYFKGSKIDPKPTRTTLKGADYGI